MLRRSKAISKKRDRPGPGWGRCEVERRGRCCLSPGSGFSPGCRGWGRGTRTETGWGLDDDSGKTHRSLDKMRPGAVLAAAPGGD